MYNICTASVTINQSTNQKPKQQNKQTKQTTTKVISGRSNFVNEIQYKHNFKTLFLRSPYLNIAYVTMHGSGIMAHRKSQFFLERRANSGIEYKLGEKHAHGVLCQFEGSQEVLTTNRRMKYENQASYQDSRNYCLVTLTNFISIYCQNFIINVSCSQKSSKRLCDSHDWKRKKLIVFSTTGQLFGLSVVFQKRHGMRKQETWVLLLDLP